MQYFDFYYFFLAENVPYYGGLAEKTMAKMGIIGSFIVTADDD